MSPLDDAPAAGSRRAAVRERADARQDAIVASLRSLGTVLDGEPDPDFRAATRARLVAMAADLTPEPEPGPRSLVSRWAALRAAPASSPGRSPVRRRLSAGLAVGALAVCALATLVAVATGASPGDPLYGLKRGTEQTQLALSGSDRGLTLLGFAHTRLTELAALAGSGDAALAVATLRDMDDETTRGAAAFTARAVGTRDPAAARQLASWGADQTAGLTGIRPRLPAGAQPAADQTAALMARVTDRGAGLAAALECTPRPALGGSDPLGPVPLTCPTAPANAQAPTGGASPGGSTAPGGGTTPEGSATNGGTAVNGGTAGTLPVPGTTSTQAVPPPAPGGSGATGVGGTVGTVTGGSVTGGAGTGGSSSGRSGGGGVLPTVPGLPTTGLPSTSLPRTGSPSVPVPPAGTAPLPGSGSILPTNPVPVPVTPSLPGTAPTAGSGGPRTGTGGLPGVPVCVPPLTTGSC